MSASRPIVRSAWTGVLPHRRWMPGTTSAATSREAPLTMMRAIIGTSCGCGSALDPAAQRAVQPPSMGMAAPLMLAAASEHR